MRILITGAAGFIGSNLVERLLRDGHHVIGLDNLSSGKLEFLNKSLKNSKFEFYRVDLIKDDISEYFHNVDEVWHLAANAEVRKYNMHIFMEQVEMTRRVLNAMEKTDVKKIIFTSSSVVYGEALTDGKPTKEEHPFLPISLYAASKIASEALIEAWSALNNTKAWVFRLANVVGPRATHGVIFDFVKKLKENPKELEILGNGNQRKSYIYVDDCIDAMLIGRNKSNMNVNIFNIGSEDWITVKEIAEIVSKVMGLRPEFKFTGGDRGWPGDVPLMKLDISKIRSLGFRPRLSSKEAVERTATWLLNYL